MIESHHAIEREENSTPDNNEKFFDKKREGFWTSTEAADYLRTTPKQIRNWVYQGKLIYYKLLGRKLLFRKNDLDALLSKGGF